MKSFWLSLMAATLAIAPMTSAYAKDAKPAAQAADDDDDDDAPAAKAPAATKPAATAKPAAKPVPGMPASAMNAEAMGLAPLSRTSQDVPTIVLGSADNSFTVNQKDFVLRAGQGYRWKVESKGDLEYKFHAPEFFRDVWFNQIVISDLEVHMAGPPAWLEFDSKGPILMQFNTIRPGNYTWYVAGLDGAQGMKGTITVVP